MTRGPAKGTTHIGSRIHLLASLDVGEYVYIETTAEQYANVMRSATVSDRTPALAGRSFVCGLYRALGTRVEDVRVLVRIERIT